MSRPPHNFADDRPQSPFDRPGPSQGGPPPSFKTNVNRNKTRKWTEAKQNTYDGDEWGGFDPYDEYGNYDEQPAALQNPRMRQNSFERGEERRAFSAGHGPPPGQPPRGYPSPQLPYAGRPRTGSQDGRSPGPRREFTHPAQVPQPLHMRSGHSPLRAPPGPSNPPRKSSFGPADPLPLKSQDDSASKPAAAIPFVRPSDIYKRMEQEKERARLSEDSSRPSMDSQASKAPGAVSAQPIASSQSSSAPTTAPPPAAISAPASEFSSIIDRAFHRPDENSVPPTPIIANRGADDLSRSNTDSTHGISPIMSRVPSAATAEARAKSLADQEQVVPTITEETGGPPPGRTTPSQQKSAVAQAPLPGHARKVSTPSPHASPARSPKIETTGDRRLSQPMSADIARDESEVPQSAASTYPQELGDATLSTGAGPPDVTKAQPFDTPILRKTSQPNTPLSSPIERRASPALGRVRDLTERYNDIHDQSRRNSQFSLTSKKSASSLNRGDDPPSIRRTRTGDSSLHGSIAENAALASTTEQTSTSPERPGFLTQPSFRPHLPGEWISTSNIAADLSHPKQQQDSSATQSPAEKEPPKVPVGSEAPPSNVDFTPTIDRSASTKTTASSPIDSLKAAGTALGASLMASAGAGHRSRDFASTDRPEDHDSATDDTPKRSVGDVFMKPLEFERTASSVASSSAAPTPLPKDTPGIEGPSSDAAYFANRTRSSSRSSWEGSGGSDAENDDKGEQSESARLRDEIVRSLTPQGLDATAQQARDQDAIDTPENLRHLQQSDGIKPSQPSPLRSDFTAGTSETETEGATTAKESDSNRAGLLTDRFSWENKPTTFFNPSALGDEVELPHTGLRVVNAAAAEDSPVDETPPVASAQQLMGGSGKETPAVSDTDDGATENPRSIHRDASPPVSQSRAVDDETASTSKADDGSNVPTLTDATSPASTSAQAVRLPPFREILAIKSAPERIDKYNTTRKQFADMNTGLQDWLSTTIATHPEHAHLSSGGQIIPGAAPTAAAFNKSRAPPSLMKMAKVLGPSKDGSTGVQDGTAQPSAQRKTSSNIASSHSPQSSVNVEKMQAKGKDFLSTAGKLGGKGVVGAKGWLAKGKQKLRETSGSGEKVD